MIFFSSCKCSLGAKMQQKRLMSWIPNIHATSQHCWEETLCFYIHILYLIYIGGSKDCHLYFLFHRNIISLPCITSAHSIVLHLINFDLIWYLNIIIFLTSPFCESLIMMVNFPMVLRLWVEMFKHVFFMMADCFKYSIISITVWHEKMSLCAELTERKWEKKENEERMDWERERERCM